MEKRFVILQTDDYDFQFESDSEKDAEFLMGTLDALMRDNNRGKLPSTLRGMHLSATDEGADRITPDISRELFGVEISWLHGYLHTSQKELRMVREEDWQDAKKMGVPKGATLLAVIKDAHINEGCYVAVIETDKNEDLFETVPQYCHPMHPFSDILWWQAIEMPSFGVDDKKTAWEYVLEIFPELTGCKSEKLEGDKDLHDPAVFGCMWRVFSPTRDGYSVDIYVRTTDDPKYAHKLVCLEFYCTLDLRGGRKRRAHLEGDEYAEVNLYHASQALCEYLGLG